MVPARQASSAGRSCFVCLVIAGKRLAPSAGFEPTTPWSEAVRPRSRPVPPAPAYGGGMRVFALLELPSIPSHAALSRPNCPANCPGIGRQAGNFSAPCACVKHGEDRATGAATAWPERRGGATGAADPQGGDRAPRPPLPVPAIGRRLQRAGGRALVCPHRIPCAECACPPERPHHGAVRFAPARALAVCYAPSLSGAYLFAIFSLSWPPGHVGMGRYGAVRHS